MGKGLLFVLLALSLSANARDTSNDYQLNSVKNLSQAKQKIVLVVSVLDNIAFTEADTSSLKRYINKILPGHQLIHVTENTSVLMGPRPIPSEVARVRESIKEQIGSKISNNFEITHFIIMDHGNTNFNESAPETGFKFLSSFGASGVHPEFKDMFSPLVGKFSDNAFVMLESCSTMCESVGLSQKRVKTFMDYFKIGNGTLFGAYQAMLSQGHESGFHLGQIANRMKSAVFISTSMAIGIASQVPNISNGHFDIAQFVMYTLGTHIIAPAVLKVFNFLQQKSSSVNWGYLYKMKNQKIEKIFNLNPYENQKELYMKLAPNKFKAELNSCNSLFH